MRIGARITSGIWVSIPFTFMGFMMGGWVVAILIFFASLFLWPVFVVDFLKEENGKTLLKVCGTGYLLLGLYGTFFEPMKRATPTGEVYTGWYFISILSLIVCVAYFVVGFDFDLSRKNNSKDKVNAIKPIIKTTDMTPRKFEELVAEYYQSMGYTTETTPYSDDYGVDVIAQKGEERIAIQAKMYGNSARKVNRQTVMQLFGAMTYRQCNKAVIATDGTCMPDAIEVAHQLGIEIQYFDSAMKHIESNNESQNDKKQPEANSSKAVISFDEMWEKYVMPLSGKTIENDGLRNRIISVDWGGLKRSSSNGNTSRISIEDFKIAYDLLLKNGSVERATINQFANRCSSAIVLVFSQVPFIGVDDKPNKVLYLKSEQTQTHR